MTYSTAEINDMTGFANGDKFQSADQVREYFTVAEQRAMCDPNFEEDVITDQAVLDEMAEVVIETREHCEF